MGTRQWFKNGTCDTAGDNITMVCSPEETDGAEYHHHFICPSPGVWNLTCPRYVISRNAWELWVVTRDVLYITKIMLRLCVGAIQESMQQVILCLVVLHLAIILLM